MYGNRKSVGEDVTENEGPQPLPFVNWNHLGHKVSYLNASAQSALIQSLQSHSGSIEFQVCPCWLGGCFLLIIDFLVVSGVFVQLDRLQEGTDESGESILCAGPYRAVCHVDASQLLEPGQTTFEGAFPVSIHPQALEDLKKQCEQLDDGQLRHLFHSDLCGMISVFAALFMWSHDGIILVLFDRTRG